jgi:hypothetical protein
VAGSPPALVTVDITKEVKAPTTARGRGRAGGEGGKSSDRRGDRTWGVAPRILEELFKHHFFKGTRNT